MSNYYEHTLDPAGVRPRWLRDDDFYFVNDEAFPDKWFEGARYDWHGLIKRIRIPEDHPAVPALRKGMEPWLGGDSAPEDWDGGQVLLRKGTTTWAFDWLEWRHSGGSQDIIGYTKRPASPAVYPEGLTPDLAARMMAFVRSAASDGNDVAKAILDDLEPVDPDLVLAQEVAENYFEAFYDRDDLAGVAFAAIKRVRAATAKGDA